MLVQFADLVSKALGTDSHAVWENERTPTSVRRFGGTSPHGGLSIRETVAILELLGTHHSQGAVWNWVLRSNEQVSEFRCVALEIAIALNESFGSSKIDFVLLELL